MGNMKNILLLILSIFLIFITLYGVFQFFVGGKDYILAAFGLAGIAIITSLDDKKTS